MKNLRDERLEEFFFLLMVVPIVAVLVLGLMYSVPATIFVYLLTAFVAGRFIPRLEAKARFKFKPSRIIGVWPLALGWPVVIPTLLAVLMVRGT